MGPIHWYWIFNFSYFAWIGMELWVFSRDRRAVSGASADRGSIWFIVAVFTAGLVAAFNASFLSINLCLARIISSICVKKKILPF